MKRWFCGFSSSNNSSLANLPQPKEGQILWEGANPFWVCGTWAKQQIITLFEGHVRLAIVGTCLEPYESLVELFHNAVRNHDYSRLMRLPGSYNLIVQEEADTYVFTDVAGLRPAFYTVYDSGVVYSSLGVALQQLIKAEVDLSWLASSLLGLSINLVQNRSPFCNVQAIPPGHYLQISSGKPTCKQYWHAPEEYISFSEAAEKLREQLLTAVEGRVRLYENVSSDLSGGFDSTSLALIAAKSLATRNHQLYTITAKTVSATESKDIKCAEHAASFYPNIVALMVEGEEIPAKYSNLGSIPLTDAPDLVILAIGSISYLMGIIKSKDSQLHMSGEAGDAVLEAPYSYLADLLRCRRLGTFFQHIHGWSRVKSLSPMFLMRGAIELSLTSYRQWLIRQIRELMAGQLSYKPFRTHPPINQLLGWEFLPEVVNWHTKQAIDSVLEQLQNLATVATAFADSPGKHESIAVIHFNAFSARIEQQLAEAFGVNLEFPYLDSLVIDACLCARPEERTSPFIYKPLLSKALEYDLPKSVFHRNTKGEYTTDESIGFRQQLDTIKGLFQSSLLADIGLIDIKELHFAIKQFSVGLDPVLWHFDQTVAIELWLRRVVNASNCFWIQQKKPSVIYSR